MSLFTLFNNKRIILFEYFYYEKNIILPDAGAATTNTYICLKNT